jgi:hypothetical protein
MKYSTTILFGVSLAVVAGLFGSGIFGLTITKADQASLGTTGLFTGHVITTLTDSDGNIKAYRQSDNLIVNQGENCALKLLFQAVPASVSAAGNVCTGANTIGFRYIEIGNVSATQSGTPSSPVSTDFRLYGSHNNTGSAGNNPGLLRKEATTITWSNSTSSTSTGAAQVILAATFTNSGASSKTVNESGLFNNTAANFQTDAMFSRQVFSTITMAPSDSLTVQWTINVGGTTTIN